MSGTTEKLTTYIVIMSLAVLIGGYAATILFDATFSMARAIIAIVSGAIIGIIVFFLQRHSYQSS